MKSFCLAAKTIHKNALKHRDFCSLGINEIFLPYGKKHSQKRVEASRFLFIDIGGKRCLTDYKN